MPQASPPQAAPRTAIFSRLPVTAVGIAIAAALVLAVIGPAPVDGRTSPPQGPAIAERMLVFTDLPNLGVGVFQDGTKVAEFDGEQGFVRGLMRGLMRGRMIRDLPRSAPFHLAAYADGRLILDDPSTGTRLEMAAYGSDNEAVFAALLPVQQRPAPERGL